MTQPSEHVTPDGLFTVRDSGLQVTLGGTGPEFLRPDFVMVGVSRPGGGVLLFASMDLTEAALKREMDKLDPFDLVPTPAGVARLPKVKTTVTAQMNSFTQIYADSYPEAVQSLQELWGRAAQAQQPRREPGPALPPGM